MDKAVEEYCFGCSKKRPCKITGTYRYEGETHKIYVCQWCRAATTKRQRSESWELQENDGKRLLEDELKFSAQRRLGGGGE